MSLFILRRDTRPEALKTWLDQFISTDRPDATSHDLARLYATSVVAYRAGNKRADAVALGELVIKDKFGEPLSKTDPLMQAMSRDYRDNMRRSELSLCFWGRNLLWKNRNYSGSIYKLRWINPSLWYPDEDLRGGLKGFRVIRRGRGYEVPRQKIERRDAVYMHSIDFEDDFDGVAPVEVAFRYAELGVEMVETQVSFMRNRAVPAAIVQPAEGENPLTDGKTVPMMQRMLQRLYQGARNAGRTLIQTMRWEWVQLQGKWDENAFTEQFDQSFEAVSMAFDMPLALIRESASNYAQAEVARRDWGQSWLVPRWEWYAERYTEDLCSDYAVVQRYGSGLTVAIDSSKVGILKEDMAAKTNVVNAQVQGGYRSLYSAAKATQVDVDGDAIERLRDYYIWGGLPTHISQIDQVRSPALPAPSVDTSTPNQVDESAHPLPPRPTEAGDGDAAIPQLPAATQADTQPPEGSKSLCLMIGLSNNPDLIALQATVKERCAAIPVKWNAPDSFHVTLIYAPAVTDAQITAVKNSLADIDWPEDLALWVGSLNSFDNLGEHALHFRVRNNPILLELQESLYDLCIGHGLSLSTYSLPEKYKPHITMGYASEKPPAITFHTKIQVTPQELLLGVGDDIAYRCPWNEDDNKADEAAPASEKRDWIPDAQFKELTDWRKICERKGRTYAFEPRELADHEIVTFIRESLLDEKHEIPQVFDVAKSALADKAEVEVAFDRLAGIKGIDDYRRTIRSQVRGFWAGQITKFDFTDGMFLAVRRNYHAAWADVAKGYGLSLDALSATDLNRLEAEIADEATFITGFADAVDAGTKVKGGQLAPLLQRADLWVEGFRRQEDIAKVLLGREKRFKWRRDPSKPGSCPDCKALDGLVLTGDEWAKLGITPKSRKLNCHGFNCGCRFDPTDEPVSERTPPALIGPKSADDHEHPEPIAEGS
jgi:2'-5' RNA ligase